MTDRLIHCDGSDFAFSLVQDGRDWVSVPYYRGESLSIEFRESSPANLQLAIAAWLLRLSLDPRARQ